MQRPSSTSRHWLRDQPHRGVLFFLFWVLLFAGFQLLDSLRQVAGWGARAEATAQVELGSHAQSVAAGALDSLAGGDAVRGPYTVQVALADSSVWQRLGLQTGTIVAALLGIAVAVVLWQLVTSSGDGELFTRANVRRLQAVAALVGAGGLAQQMLAGSAQFWATVHSPLRDDITWSVEITLLPLFFGAAILVVAAVWARAVTLREDTEGLV